MPGKVKVKIISGRNLPVMDRSSDTTDAYVEIKLGCTTYKTDVCRKSLHPQWNSEWYRFEVDDAELQDEPLQIRLMDHDTYSANDAIGKVYLDLNPLLLPSWSADNNPNHEHSSNSMLSGWIPVYDTMHGIRGEVHLIVKVELFSDFNRFRQSSCGIRFFCSKSIPFGYFAQTVHGFVEELIVNDDPEYQWIDKIRTPRATNEARQTLFFKLSRELQRKIGVKALDLGGNAVIGYSQCFDLEGECGIVGRGIGTAVTLVKVCEASLALVSEHANEERAQSYLKFLGADAAGFRLNYNSKFIHENVNPSPLNLPVLNIDHPRYKPLAKCLNSTNLNQPLRPTQSNPSLNQNLNQRSVKTLLMQEEMRGTPGCGISQKFKNLKYSSQNILLKKMTALKAKLGDAGIEEIDETLLLENKPQFSRTVSESSVMAELLARSVIQAHNSLSCILEHQDSLGEKNENETSSINGSKVVLNPVFENDEPTLFSLRPNRSSSGSSSNLNSFEEYDDDDDDDDEDYDASNSNNSINFETISNIIKNVEIMELENYPEIRNSFSKQISMPILHFDKIVDEETNPFIFEMNETQEINFGETSAPIAVLEDDSPVETEKNSSIALNEVELPTTIIPPVVVDEGVQHQGLMKTALQTMLFEKLNIVGSYTPPSSPVIKTPPANNLMDQFTPSLPQTNTIRPSHVLNTPSLNLARSSTSVSLNEWQRNHETVLGAPFTSIHKSLHRHLSHPCLILSNLNYDKFLTEEINKDHFASSISTRNNEFNMRSSQDHLPKRKLSFTSSFSGRNDDLDNKSVSPDHLPKRKFSFISLFSGRNNDLNNKSYSQDHLPKRKFSFLSLHRRKSHEPQTNLVKLKRDDLPKGKFKLLRHRKSDSGHNAREKTSKDKSFFHFSHLPNIFHHKEKQNNNDNDSGLNKHGLLGTALGNVAMETVQDILATSHSEKKKSGSSKLPPTFPLSNILPSSTNDHNFSDNTTYVDSVPVLNNIDSTLCGNNTHASLNPSLRADGSSIQESQSEQKHQRTESVGTKIVQSPAKFNNIPGIHRRSSDSDLSITPKGNSLTGSDRSGGASNSTKPFPRATIPQENFDMLEYPFLTMSKYPLGFIMQIGGAVSARSVKLLERISNLEEPESRDTWWSEIRMEIRSHARALNCNAVLGYSETTSICDDVCVLSASGTAALIGSQHSGEMVDCVTGLPLINKSYNTNKDLMSSSLDRHEFEKEKPEKTLKEKSFKIHNDSPEQDVFGNHIMPTFCNICHLPYNKNNVPLRATILKCGLCRIGKVSEVMIATIEVPDGAPTAGRGCFVQSFVARPLKDTKGESNAKEISDGLPFLEYELHRLLMSKLKIKGMNALFGLKIRISIGEKMLVGLATATAVYLTALPPPILPKLVSDRSDDSKLNDLQKLLNETVKKNKEIYQLKNIDDNQNSRILSDDESDEEQQTSTDFSMGNKDCCILEVDDPEDRDILNMLMEQRPPDGFHVVNTEFVPGLEELEIVKNLQMFTQIYRGKFHHPSNFDIHFQRLLQSVYFKLRRMIPCALCDLQFRIDLPEPDEIQLCVLGMALGLGDPPKQKLKRKNTATKRNDDELIFNLEEDQAIENNLSTVTNQNFLSSYPNKFRQKSPLCNRIQTLKQRHVPYKERHGVDITPLSYVPGGKVEHYLGNLNFFFIRETTSIREEGGLSGFIHSFVTEVLAIVRAHVTALGGNAMVSYFMSECILNHSLHKNQGQCLINVGGDVVFVSYYSEEA